MPQPGGFRPRWLRKWKPGRKPKPGAAPWKLAQRTFSRIYTLAFVFPAMPSLGVPSMMERVTSLSFPSLRKVGDLYSNRLDSPLGRCSDDCWFCMANETLFLCRTDPYVKTSWRARLFLIFTGAIAIRSAQSERHSAVTYRVIAGRVKPLRKRLEDLPKLTWRAVGRARRRPGRATRSTSARVAISTPSGGKAGS